MTITPDDRVALRSWALLGLFLLIHIINQIDRAMISSFGPEIVRELGLSHAQFGFLTGLAFTASYAAMALGAGLLADRIGRTKILAAGLAIWSFFTVLSGLARSFVTLAAARPLVAAGEATLIPTATAIITDHFPAHRHAGAIGIFFMGIPLGLGASYLIAAQLGPTLGWRGCFVLMGAIGLALSLVVLRVHDRRAPRAAAPPALFAGLGTAFALLRSNARLRLAAISVLLLHFHAAGMPFMQLWLTGDRGLAADVMANRFGTMVILFGTLGALTTGLIGDWLRRRYGMDRALFLALYLSLIAPLILAFRLAPPDSLLFSIGMAASALFLASFYGPCLALMREELPGEIISTMTGLIVLLINLLVSGLGALLIGLASDALRSTGASATLTGPLLAADLIAFLAIPGLYLLVRRQKRAS